MNEHVYPTVINKGKRLYKPKISLNSRVNANTQRKIDKINRYNIYMYTMNVEHACWGVFECLRPWVHYASFQL